MRQQFNNMFGACVGYRDGNNFYNKWGGCEGRYDSSGRHYNRNGGYEGRAHGDGKGGAFGIFRRFFGK